MQPTIEEVCRRSVEAGHLSAEDAQRWLARYRDLLSKMSEPDARRELAREVEAEANRRQLSAKMGLRALGAYRNDPDNGMAKAKHVYAVFYKALGGEDPKLFAKPPPASRFARPIERIGVLIMILGAVIVACGAYYYVSDFNRLGRYIEKLADGPFEAVRRWQQYKYDGAVAFGWFGLFVALVGAVLAFGYGRLILPIVTWVRTGQQRPPN